MLMLMSGAAAAHAGGANFVNNDNFEMPVARIFHASSCAAQAHEQECGTWSGRRAMPPQRNPWAKPRSLMGTVLTGGPLEQMLPLPVASRYAMAWSEAGSGSASAPHVLQLSWGGARPEQPAFAPGTAAATPLAEESVPVPTMYATLVIGLCLLAFTSRAQRSPIFA